MYIWASQMAQQVKNPPALPEMQDMQVQSLGWEDPVEQGMAAHSSILAGKILWTEKPGDYNPQGCKELDMTKATEHASV